MRVGVIFPTMEIGSDPGGIRDYIETAEGLGYSHILGFDHVLGAGTATRPDWKGPYNHANPFHEPFVLFGFIAAISKRIEMATGVLILPQRQTALVAKQAAQIDVLSNGRLRLGVGLGWNEVEYQGLGKNFHDRGARVEEQVVLLRKLWANELITFNGKYDQIPDAGINPLPVKKRIPVWFGGRTEPALKRLARIADGWFPLFGPGEKGAASIEQVREYLRASGRGVSDFGSSFGMDPMLHTGRGVSKNMPPPEKDPQFRTNVSGAQEWAAEAEWWKKHSATHISLNTMIAGREGPKPHIEAISQFAAAMNLPRG